MRNRRSLPQAAIAVTLAATLVPAAALARGGAAHGGHGPVFGFHRAPIVAHRPFRPVFANHFPARFAQGWRLHRFGRNRGDNANGVADAGYAGGYYPGAGYGGYGAGDTTGPVAPGPAWTSPSAPPAEHIGCIARGYDVVSESGGVARVTVTRC